MKTVKSRVVLLMTAMTILICAALGVMNVALNRLTAEGVLKQSMTQVAALAAARIEKELDVTKQVAIDTGCMPNMGKAYISSLDKKKIVQQQAQAHGLTDGNLLDINGISVFDGTDFSDRDYYQAAMKGEAYVSGPMLSKLTGEYVVVIAAPVWLDGQVGTEITGVVYFKPDLSMLSAIVSDISIGETGKAYIINKDGLVIAHGDASKVFVDNAAEAAKTDASLTDLAAIESKMTAGQAGYGTFKRNGTDFVQGYAPVPETDGWSVGVYAEENEFMGNVTYSVWLTVCICAAALAAAVIAALVLVKKALKPVRETARFASALAAGQLDESITIRTKDEIGQLQHTLDTEVRGAFKAIGEARHAAEKQARYQSAEVEKLLVNLRRLANGELDCEIAVVEGDEDTAALHGLFSEIAENLHGGLDGIKGYISEISSVLGEMAQGNLNVGIEAEFRGDFAALKQSINAIAASLNAVLGDISTAAEQVASGTRQVSGGSQEISQGATEQASSIEELTASISQIAEQTRQNAASANTANELTGAAQAGATRGSAHMQAMQDAMAQMNESSRSISKIIKVIDDIAFQTNILALNAAVEAARAGVHGKGFAVVAEEVRNLAARSAGAAKETTELIEGSIKKTAAGTKIANETAAALGEIVEGIQQAGQLVSEIAVASGEQAMAISQVNRGIEQLSAVVQTNSATAEEAAAASEELSGQAETLRNLVGQFALRGQADNRLVRQVEAAPDVTPLSEGESIDPPEDKNMALPEDSIGKY